MLCYFINRFTKRNVNNPAKTKPKKERIVRQLKSTPIFIKNINAATQYKSIKIDNMYFFANMMLLLQSIIQPKRLQANTLMG